MYFLTSPIKAAPGTVRFQKNKQTNKNKRTKQTSFVLCAYSHYYQSNKSGITDFLMLAICAHIQED